MTTDDIKRLYFYERQFLGARDLQTEQEYHIEMRRRHLVAHHRWGIVAGLEITQDQDSKLWYVAPGLAVDAFGREIIVFEPEPLNTNSIADQLAGEPRPALLKVWIAYRTEKTARTPPNFRVCDSPDQYMRVRETFRLIYQNVPPFDLAPTADPAKQSAENRETWPHAFQDLPDDPKLARWPLYLGTLTWDVAPGDPAQNLITAVAAVDPKDNRRRRYVGVVAEEIEAPNDSLLIRGRGHETPLAAAEDGVPVKLEGSLEVLRQLTADRNLNVLGRVGVGIGLSDPDTRLQVGGGKAAALADQTGYAVIGKVDDRNLVFDDRTVMARNNKAAAELRLQPEGGDLSVHATTQGTGLFVKASGEVGLGTNAPDEKLEIAGGGNLLFKAPQAAPEDAGDIIFRNFFGAQKGRIWSEPGSGAGLLLSSGDNDGDIAIDSAGSVGVGTKLPQRKLHVVGEAHSAGGAAGYSFSSRETPNFVSNPASGERWVWYAQDGQARLWSGGSKLTVNPDGGVRAQGGVAVDDADANAGSFAPGLVFGHNSGECIASKRTPGGNRYGLDFYTNFLPRMGLTQGGRLGVGTLAPAARLHVSDNESGSADDISNHVAIIENTAADFNADVLALKVGQTFPFPPGGGNNFISFFAGDNLIGSIEGTSGSVAFGGPGGDYAEWLPRLDPAERIEAGDIVGVRGGRITRETTGAQHVMAIASRPIVLGNAPAPEAKALHEKVSFLGQVRVKVRGAVQAGDYLVPSGLHDGTAVAVAPHAVGPQHDGQIVGRAWESAAESGVSLINTAVGLPCAAPQASLSAVVIAMQAELQALRAEVAELRAARGRADTSQAGADTPRDDSVK